MGSFLSFLVSCFSFLVSREFVFYFLGIPGNCKMRRKVCLTQQDQPATVDLLEHTFEIGYMFRSLQPARSLYCDASPFGRVLPAIKKPS